MDFLADSVLSAVLLLWSLDPELLDTIGVSLKVSGSSTAIAGLISIPAGLLVAFREFWGKHLLITVLNTLLAMPTVGVGLFVYAFISRRGIFGPLDLLYTQNAMIIGQVILIVPIITVFTISAVSRIDELYRETALTLGANAIQTARVVLREARFGIVAAIIMAYGRVIAEVGISMMLGGNAKGFTRTMTTAMALEYDKGEFVLSVALGVVLLVISFGRNIVFHHFQGKVARSTYENIFTGTIAENEGGERVCILQSGLNLRVSHARPGPARISIDPEMIEIKSLDQDRPGTNTFRGKLIQLTDEGNRIRALVDAGTMLSVLIPKNRANGLDKRLGTEYLVHCPEDSIEIF